MVAARHSHPCVTRLTKINTSCRFQRKLKNFRQLQAVSLYDVIHQQIEAFETPDITLVGNPVLVLPTAVQAISLTMHELIANAWTHGALSSVSGTIDIGWTKGPQEFRIRWLENGGPEPVPTRSNGFGHVIIGALIEKQLKGQVKRTWEPAGLQLELIIPVDQLPQPASPSTSRQAKPVA